MQAPYEEYDRLVIGAGIFGLFAAALLTARGLSVGVVDVDRGPIMRASLVNQARVHNGYHYPRSAFTALRSTAYYQRFLQDFPDAINQRFKQVYAIASTGSYTAASQFEDFCHTVGIPAEAIDTREMFRDGVVEAAYVTDEYGFDAPTLRKRLLGRIDRATGLCSWHLGDCVSEAVVDGDAWRVRLRSGPTIRTAGVVNATYAGINGVLETFGLDLLPLKYELCEVLLVDAPAAADVGVTVMDGSFFSLMPFGHTGRHSLTAVDYTPRVTSTAATPVFPCQASNPACHPSALDNCGLCLARPVSVAPQMLALARRYLRDGGSIRGVEALHSVKTVLKTAEVDDSRPTFVKVHRAQPSFISVFSGKINTVYDLESIL